MDEDETYAKLARTVGEVARTVRQAFLEDVGYIPPGIPEAVLDKPLLELTQEERDTVSAAVELAPKD